MLSFLRCGGLLEKKNSHDSSIAQGKGVASSTPNAKANKPKETIFARNHRMSKALVSIDLVKEMMEQNIIECPYDYVLGKEFLPNFAVECNDRLSYMRVFQKWYLWAVKLGLEGVSFTYPARDIFGHEDVDFQKLTMPFEDIQFLYRQKRLDLSQLTLWCL